MTYLRLRESGPEVVDWLIYVATDEQRRAQCEEVAPPQYDTATQKAICEFKQIAGNWTQVWSIVSLSAAEIDAKAQDAEGIRLRAMIDSLLAGSGTAGDRIQRLEHVAAWLLRKTL